MGREVFVSYKFSDAFETREELRTKLGKEGHSYNGEKGFKPLKTADSTIKEYLKDMIFRTSVTVVVISPQVRFSDWVDWEIRYSLRQPSRFGVTSHRNGILCVIQNCRDPYGNLNTKWAHNYDGGYRKDIFPQAIIDNLQTTFPDMVSFYMKRLNSNYRDPKDYCVIVSESVFKADPTTYIEEAYRRAHDDSYTVCVNKTDF